MIDRTDLDDIDRIDRDLRSKLRSLRPPAAAVEALELSVMKQWSERQGRPDSAPRYLGGQSGVSVLGLIHSRRRLWAGLAAGLVAGALIATVVWVQRPDPLLDELMHADVLSQMAIDEM